jgi:hypothetical protein
MRTLTDQESRIYSQTNRHVRLRVKIANSGGTLTDIDSSAGGPWLLGAEWGEDVDSPGQTATIQLRAASDRNQLSPLATLARQTGTLALYRAVTIETAILPYGATVATWTEVFRGRIDSIDWATEPLTIACRDQIATLQDRFIELAPNAYSDAGGNPVEDILQELLDDTLGAGVITLYTPSSPGWNITEFATSAQSLYDQLTLLTTQIGWNLRYKWDSGSSAFRLTFYEPDRSTTTSMRTFGPSEIFSWELLSVALDDIRNAVSVTYGDTSVLDAAGQPTPTTETAEDAASIAAYGRRWMGITEDATSNIDTSTEAAAMAAACLSDLSEPLANASVTIPFFHAVELEDRYTLAADNFHLDASQILSVVGFRHTVRSDNARTTLQLRGTVAAGFRSRWLSMAAQPGIGPLIQNSGPTGGALSSIENPGSLAVSAALGKNRGISKNIAYEVHAGPPGFVADLTEGSSTVVSRTAGEVTAQILADLQGRTPIGELVDVALFPVDHLGNYGDELRVSDLTAQRLGTHFLASDQRFAGSFFGSVFAFQARGPNYPPDGWHMVTGAWSTDLDLDTGGIYSAPQTGLKALTLKNTTVATKARSDRVPVSHGRRYHFQAALKVSSVSYTVQIAVEWLNSGGSVLATSYLQNGVAASAGTWLTLRRTAAPPTGAVQARFFVAKQAAAFYVSVDRLLWEEYDPTVESKVHRLEMRDDFAGGDDASVIGDLGWQPGFIGSDLSDIITLAANRYPAAATALPWTRFGAVRMQTPANTGGVKTNHGALLYLGSATYPGFFGPPPEGIELRCRVKVDTTTQIQVWIGFWSSTSILPDPGLVNTIYGFGFALRATASTTAWQLITRNGTVETLQTLGTLASAGWVELGLRKTSTGFQGFVEGVDTGSEITTNIPGSSQLLFPVIGVITTNTTEKTLDLDSWLLIGDLQR